MKVRIEIVERLNKSPHAPSFTSHSLMKRVMEDDPVGHMVELLQAGDQDRDDLFYSIIGILTEWEILANISQ